MRKKSIILALALVIISSVLTMACAKENDEKSTYLHGDETEANEQAEVKAAEEEKPALEETPVEEFKYEYDAKYEGIRITRYKGEKINIVIPKEIEGDPVVSVDLDMYGEHDNNIKSIVYPETVRYVDLGYVSIMELSLPETCETVRLENCGNLTEISFPEKCENVWIMGCENLTQITIPQNCKNFFFQPHSDMCAEISFPKDCICNVTLSGMDNITEFSLPEGYSGHWVFYYCENLKSIELPAGNKRQDVSLEHCNQITSLVYPEGTEEVYGYILRNANLTSIEFPSSIKRISMKSDEIQAVYDDCKEFSEALGENDGAIGFGYESMTVECNEYDLEMLEFAWNHSGVKKVVFHMPFLSTPDSIKEEIKKGFPWGISQVEWDDEVWTLNKDALPPFVYNDEVAHELRCVVSYLTDEMCDAFWTKNPK